MKGRPLPDRPYTILLRGSHELKSRVDLGHKVRERAGDILKQIDAGSKVLLVTQDGIPEIWRNEIVEAVNAGGFTVAQYMLPDGEACKSTDELAGLWAKLQSLEFTRQDCILALGGGAVTDAAGFAAATYLRGTRLVLVPTTLLAQVDASIGGKTAINLKQGKNLAGSFYFPHSVLIDPDLLSTLSERDFRSGLGEIVKYGLIEKTVTEKTDYKPGPRPLLQAIEENFSGGKPLGQDVLLPIIACCVRMKLAVVLADPFESGLRRCLNLGHTLGHAIEKVSDFQVSHGEAVSIGSQFACSVAARAGRLPAALSDKFLHVLQKLQLPHMIPDLPTDRLVEAMAHDKKRKGNAIKFVLPEKELGKVVIDYDLPVDRIADLLEQERS